MFRSVTAVACSLLVLVLAASPASAAKGPQPASGLWEGADATGRPISFAVDRQHRIVDVWTPNQIGCGGTSVGMLFSAARRRATPVAVKRGAFRRAERLEWGTEALSGTVADATHLRGRLVIGLNARSWAPACTYDAAFTAHRIARPVADPAPGAWSGNDALGSKVSFRTSPIIGAPTVGAIVVEGPWDGCGRLTPLGGRYPEFNGGSDVAWARSRATGSFTLTQTLAGPLNVGMDAGHIVAAPSLRPDGTTVTRRLTGTVIGSAASGAWQVVVTDAAGAVLCDSGAVAWSATPER